MQSKLRSRSLYTVIAGLCSVVIASPVAAQRAFIQRPSIIAPSARTVHVKPILAGFRINESTSTARRRLGAQVVTDSLGSGPDALVSLSNPTTGITVIAGPVDGVGIILVTRRDAGALDGIKVGDRRSAVIARWGPPAAGSESAGLWIAGKWVITVTFDGEGRVARLGIGQ